MYYHREFADADEFIREATETKNEEGWNFFDSLKLAERDSFYGCANVEDAKRLAKFGWPEGRLAVEAMKVRIESRLGRHGRTFQCRWDVEGAVVDVGAYVSGEPECMVTFDEVETEKVGFVDIHFSAAVSAAVSTNEMIRNGAAIAALIDALESMGKRVRLRWERSSSKQPGKNLAPLISLSVVLKEYDQPLDLDRVAFFLTSPCARRALPWSIYTLAPKKIREWCGLHKGSAGPSTHPDNHPKYKNAEVWVSAMISETDEGCVEWVLAKLAELGVSVSEGEAQ
jgi:hypothetical protein